MPVVRVGSECSVRTPVEDGCVVPVEYMSRDHEEGERGGRSEYRHTSGCTAAVHDALAACY